MFKTVLFFFQGKLERSESIYRLDGVRSENSQRVYPYNIIIRVRVRVRVRVFLYSIVLFLL